MAKLWAGRTSGETSAAADDFNSSIRFDSRMYRQDITGSMAHAAMLGAQGIVAPEEADALIAGLQGILEDLDAGSLTFDPACEDIHMFVEQVLTERLGDVGKKLHTARSRNDQVALDTRMYLREEIDGLRAQIRALGAVLTAQAEKNLDADSRPAWESVLSFLRGGSLRFQGSIPCNLFSDDPAVKATRIKGASIFNGNKRLGAVGLIHPQRARSGGEADVSYDPLTGVMNKDQITRMATDRVDRMHAEGTTIAILDVDYFKHVNDNYGHAFGDQVLRRVAAIMENEVGSLGRVGRIGGDEFFIVFYHVTETELRACLRSIKSCVNAAFPEKGPRPGASISVTIGAAAYPKDADNYEDLFMVADYCLYLGKQKGRNRYIHYTPEKHPSLEEIRKIQAEGELE